MIDPGSPRLPRSVAEALGTGAIPGDLSAILTGRFRTVRDYGTALNPDKHSGQGIQSLLEQLASGVDHIPGLERLDLIGVDQDRTVHILHLLFSAPVDLYSTIRRIFACQGELPSEGLPPVVDITHESFAARRPISTVLRVDHTTHLGGIFPSDW